MNFSVFYCLVVMAVACQATLNAEPAVSSPVAADPTPKVAVAPVPVVASLPVPVQDTPEVAAAKLDHAAKWLAAKQANDFANLIRNYGTPYSGLYPYGSPFAFNYGGYPLAYNYGAYASAYNYRSPFFNFFPGNFYGAPYGVVPSNVAPSQKAVPV